jgi:hypothetical protein
MLESRTTGMALGLRIAGHVVEQEGNRKGGRNSEKLRQMKEMRFPLFFLVSWSCLIGLFATQVLSLWEGSESKGPSQWRVGIIWHMVSLPSKNSSHSHELLVPPCFKKVNRLRLSGGAHSGGRAP